jgi:hypothetical protein
LLAEQNIPSQNTFASHRRLIVVDECLDIVDHYAVSLEKLGKP